jgi:uncharacterized protein YprB with RNaseH-like and TPR domain
MIQTTHRAVVDERYITAMELNPETCIYFDIETTGLKAETSHLYLIGYAVQKQPGSWEITQLFAEKTEDERYLLKAFSDICMRYRTVIHFNGDRFDIPYLETKYQEYSMLSPFHQMDTADIYRMVRPYKNLLGLERLNQKTIEQFLGFRRQDRYDGGQLIWIYRAYRDGHSEDPKGDLEKLLLHNYEDVLGMLSLTMLTAYPAFFQMVKDGGKNREKSDGTEDRETWKDLPTVDVRRCSCPAGLCSVNASDGTGKADMEQAEGEMCTEELRLSLRTPVPVPVPVSSEAAGFSVELYGSKAEIHIPLRRRTLLHFFPDYKNYYYLPEEDRAVHKSVGQFVDSRFREQAKAENCYIRVRGVFLPCPSSPAAGQGEETRRTFADALVFLGSRKDKSGWIQLTDEVMDSLRSDSKIAYSYVCSLLAGICKKQKKQTGS